MSADPFAVLGLPARPDLTDDDVRSAWRRIAAGTHPDLPGGGDPARYAAASAAYAELRTGDGRGEALADRGLRGPLPAVGAGRPTVTPEPDAAPRRDTARPERPTGTPERPAGTPERPAGTPERPTGTPERPAGTPERRAAGLVWRIRRGRPALLALRVAIAAGTCAAAFGVAGAQPAAWGLAAGVLTWLLLTARHDLLPPMR